MTSASQRFSRPTLAFRVISKPLQTRLVNSSKKLKNIREYIEYLLRFGTKTPFSSLVLSTLNDALAEEPERKCFRLVGGVLVERTVKDVVPALQMNRDGVRSVLGISASFLLTFPPTMCRYKRSYQTLQNSTRPRKPNSRTSSGTTTSGQQRLPDCDPFRGISQRG